MIAALLIDLDATLVDSGPVWRVAYEQLATDRAVTLADDWWTQVAGRSLAASVAVLDPGPDPGERAALIDALVDRATARLRTHGIELLPGAGALVAAAEAHRIPVGVVTSAAARFAAAALAAVEVTVDVLVTADDDLPAKPHPAPYLEACRRLGVAPGEVLVVEDSPSGVAAGVAAGARVLAVPSEAPIAPGPRLMSIARLDLLDPEQLIAGQLAR